MPITQYHIEHPTDGRTLCYLSIESLWQDPQDPSEDIALVTLEDSVIDTDYIVEESRCSICWRDEEERILLLFAGVGE